MKFQLPLIGGLLALALAGCGGGGGGSSAVVGNDIKTNANETTTAAFANETFGFASGVAAFGTSGTATELTFTSGSSFAVSAGGKSAAGTTRYGSCIFTIATSTFEPAHPLGQVGASIRVDPCEIEIKAGGMAANGVPASRNARLVLANLASRDITAAIRVTESGQLYVGNALFGEAPIVTGSGSF
ncbi:hypothetical protein WG922_11590 [Ramlibacter sp. AN1015]|uniref:hypothetical protein n=1 Tax=Ramlibacter sp. AN1015 TaxID=3133428 RepID=UPI0030BC6C1A